MDYEGPAETERIQGALLGLACGDALGATLENVPRDQVSAVARQHGGARDEQGRWWLTHICGGGWLGLQPGQWTDDTAMALAVAEGILADPADPVPHVGAGFLAWFRSNPRGIGQTTCLALSAFSGDWSQAAQAAAARQGDRAASNGSLMRTLPVGLAYQDPEDVRRHAAAISRMTHWDQRAEDCCVAYSLTVRHVLAGAAPAAAWAEAVAALAPGPVRERLAAAPSLAYADLRASGFAVDTLEAAVWCVLHARDAEEAILHAVHLGDDADTAGAVAGGLAGAVWGVPGLPMRWIGLLEDRARIEDVAHQINWLRAGG